MEAGTAHNSSRGKWAQPGVPKKGWSCIDTSDLEEPSQICEMCEGSEIRYVHYMQHPNYPDVLEVGCICAEHMEQDYVRPKERESKLKNAASRRKNWHKKTWKISAKGNFYINTDGFNLTVFGIKNKGSIFWKIYIVNRSSSQSKDGARIFNSSDEAKSAAFDALIWAKENL